MKSTTMQFVVLTFMLLLIAGIVSLLPESQAMDATAQDSQSTVELTDNRSSNN